MFSIFSVLVTSLLRSGRKASVPIASRVCASMNFFAPLRGHHASARSNRLASLKRLCASATGQKISQQPGPSSSSPPVYQGRPPASRSSVPPRLTDSTRRPPVHLSRIESRPSSTICSAVEPLSSIEWVTINPQPYFVPPTASASEILTNVAIQDLLAQDATESYDFPYNIPTVADVSDSWDSLEFDPVNLDDYSDSDWEAGEEETTDDDTLQFAFTSIDSPNHFRDLDATLLPSLVHFDAGTDCGDGEGAIVIPVSPFPHPHLLSPIIEEDEDDTSDTETIRPSSSILPCHRLSVDTGIDWGIW